MNTNMKHFTILLFLAAIGSTIIIGLESAIFYLIVAMVLAYLMFPFFQWLEAFRIRREYAVIGGLILLYFTFISFFIAIIPYLYEEIQAFVQALPQTVDIAMKELQKLSDKMGLGITFDEKHLIPLIEQYASNISDDTVKSITAFLEEALSSTAKILVSVANLYMLPLFFFYLVNDYEKIIEGIHSLIPKSMLPKANSLLSQSNIILKNYIRGRLLLAGIRAILYALGLFLLGLDFGLLIGLLTGIFSIVPYVGTSLGFIIAILVVLATDAGMGVSVGIFVVFVVVYAVDKFWLNVKIIDQESGLNDLTIMLVLMIGGNLFDTLGVFLAIPVAGILKVILREMKTNYQQSKYYLGSQ